MKASDCKFNIRVFKSNIRFKRKEIKDFKKKKELEIEELKRFIEFNKKQMEKK